MGPATPWLRAALLATLAACAALGLAGAAYADHGGRDFTDRDMERADRSRSSHDGDDRSNRDNDRGGRSDERRGDESRGRGSRSGDALKEDRRASSRRGPHIPTEIDREGHERRSGEIILIGTAASIQSVRDSGYAVISARELAALGEVLARIRIDANASMEDIIQRLRALVPEAYVAPNHVFYPSAAEARVETPRAADEAAPVKTSSATIGIIDTGVDSKWAPLSTKIAQTHSFADGGYTPRAHGTIVSEIAARQGARLVVADVFGVDSNSKLIAAADAIASAIDWLMSEQVTLMNISIEGPDNGVLAHVIDRATQRGAIIVAAAGNSGPAAPPVYPAAYPRVIAVTAVDDRGRIYPRANRGDYIAFAALGVRVPVSYPAKDSAFVSGTSFAAPAVTCELARRLAEPHEGGASAVLAELERDVDDLGARGRDPVFGWGRVRSHEPPRLARAIGGS
jgi:subtilisin family serine protease